MMQMQKIKKLCLARGTFTVINGNYAQWLSDGAAVFAVPSGIKINVGMLPAMFDLTERQVDSCAWNTKAADDVTTDGINLADNADGDILLYEVPGSITVAGDELDMLYSEDGKIALLIAREELAPLEKYKGLRYYARPSGNGWAVAVKNGYALIAYIMPWKIMGDAITNTMECMRDVMDKIVRNPPYVPEESVIRDTDDMVETLKGMYGERESAVEESK